MARRATALAASSLRVTNWFKPAWAIANPAVLYWQGGRARLPLVPEQAPPQRRGESSSGESLAPSGGGSGRLRPPRWQCARGCGRGRLRTPVAGQGPPLAARLVCTRLLLQGLRLTGCARWRLHTKCAPGYMH
eukprot:scaffold167_cov347-Prasinococcus_capsulatus_cf.AAC.14